MGSSGDIDTQQVKICEGGVVHLEMTRSTKTSILRVGNQAQRGQELSWVTRYAKAELASHLCLPGLTQLDHFLGHRMAQLQQVGVLQLDPDLLAQGQLRALEKGQG